LRSGARFQGWSKGLVAFEGLLGFSFLFYPFYTCYTFIPFWFGDTRELMGDYSN